MAEFYSYQKRRRDFGKPCKFSDSKCVTFQHFIEDEEKREKDEKYVPHNPNFIELDNITELAEHFVNTERVSTGDKGMIHKEGGWKVDTDPTEPQQYQRFMKKIDKDTSLAAAMKANMDTVKTCMMQNNQIDPFEEYFDDEDTEHQMEHNSTKTLMLFKDQPDVCKRGVSELSWHTEGATKLAVSYAISRFQQTPEKMRTNAYIWDTCNPNAPEVTLFSPSPVTNICYNHKLIDLVGGGCANGLVAVWDSRKGKDPAVISQVEKSHHDPVTHFQWLMTKTGQECVSISTDGYTHFWDMRKLQQEPT
jgi:dynein intermediate chain 2